MPPLIYNKEDEGYPNVFQYLHPGIKKTTFLHDGFAEQTHQPHVFQQSVTLTASMWNENGSKENMDWSFENWRFLGKYSPLFIGLAWGFGIVLLIMSTVMLWRYCFVSSSKKIFCTFGKGTYGEITQHQKSISLRKKSFDTQNDFENSPRKICSVGKQQKTLQRSSTTGSMSLPYASESLGKENKLQPGISTNNISSGFQPKSSPSEPLMFPNLYTSHLYLQKLDSTFIETPENLSKSTPALEDLYAKVNFSKKKKNRMRKNEAAIIAMSKSHSGQNNNSLELFGSAVVVYNERTAL